MRLSRRVLFIINACLLIFSLLEVPITLCQDTQAKYQRKSISYVDYVWLAGGGERISRLEQNLLLDAIRREIEMPRFD
ncbi:MAG: hypothetical protein ABH878_04735, partial [bacterium]